MKTIKKLHILFYCQDNGDHIYPTDARLLAQFIPMEF